MARPPVHDPYPRLAAARAAVAQSWAAPLDNAMSRRWETLQSTDLAALVDAVLKQSEQAERLRATWLLLVALTGAMPSLHELEDAWLTLSTAGPAELVAAAVARAAEPTRSHLSQCVSGTLVDVTVTAGTTNHAGVPRVVRQLVRAWGEPPGVTYVVWEAHGLRTLRDTERAALGLPPAAALPPGTWVVPHAATFAVVEVMRPEAHASAVEAMAFARVIDLRGMVYDLASVVETHPDATRGPFLHHLSALSRGSRVSAISDAVAADTSDFFAIFSRNGRSSPTVSSHVLPDDPGWDDNDDDEAVAALDAEVRGDRAWPVVTVVSSLHRRKNHARLLAACEQLWDEGLTFRVLAIEGTGSHIPALDAAIDRLVERGRPLTLLNRVSDPVLRAAYRLARVSVYVSLAEGYGLPIAESLAVGTPVVASGHGSMAEFENGGGVLLVDPRQPHSIAEGLRRVLTDDVLHNNLSTEAAERRQSNWLDYAVSVGTCLGVVAEAPPAPRGAIATAGEGHPELDLHHDWERPRRTG